MKKTIIVLVLIFLILVAVFYKNRDLFSTKVRPIIDDVEKNDVYREKELFEDYYIEALETMKNMTLEEKVGQLFLVRYNSDTVISEISDYGPCGYVLFAKDFESQTKESIHDEISKLQGLSKIPLVIAVDEEGGYVTRVSRFTNFRNERFPSPRDIYDQGGYSLLSQVESEKAELLLSLGINLNLAPVADVSVDPNDFIYSRSFRMDAISTAEFIANMVSYANKEKISSCLKHFPGYGNNVDTHNGVAVDNRSYENFINNDYLPFKSGIEASVPTILVSHNIISCLDNNYPASLSEIVISQLRNVLNFSGIIITDDLAMGAVSSYVNNGKAATLAINAGNDLIITSDFVNMYNEVLTAVNNNEIEMIKINEAVKKILAWKEAYNMKG